MDKLSIIFIQIMLWYNMLIKCDFSKGWGIVKAKKLVMFVIPFMLLAGCGTDKTDAKPKEK